MPQKAIACVEAAHVRLQNPFLGLTGRLYLRLGGNAASRVSHVLASGNLLFCSNNFEYGFDVVAKSRRVFIPDSTDFGDNRVNL